MYVSVPDKKGKYQKREKVELSNYLSHKQASRVGSSADMIWQFSQYIKADYERKGIKDVKVFVDSKVSINRSEYYQYTNPDVNIANLKWSYFGHQLWIMPQPKELKLSFLD